VLRDVIRKYLFVIDGAKALRAAIEEVFGTEQPVQRCRNHKIRNVLDELPREQHSQTLSVMRAAFRRRTAEEGEKRLEQLARFLEHEHESAARSLREGLMGWFALLFADPSLGFFFHHGDSRAIHEHVENRNRLPHDHRQIQLHGALNLVVLARGDVRADSLDGPLHGFGGHLQIGQ
jgi:hypothetical protein